MNDEQLEEHYRKGFMDKCASAGLTTEEAEELYKQAFIVPALKGAWRLGSGVFRGGIKGKAARKVAGRKTLEAGKKALPFIGSNALSMGLWYGIPSLFSGGGDTPQQPQQPAGGYGPQTPGRAYGSSKLNTRGLGGITPFLN